MSRSGFSGERAEIRKAMLNIAELAVLGGIWALACWRVGPLLPLDPILRCWIVGLLGVVASMIETLSYIAVLLGAG